ncbi:MAG: hypothetical protein ABIN67_15940, partial [Ferruginibacter sp.]
FLLIISGTIVKAQKIDSIYVNLYTDSLKKGTYNYINVDGRLSNGSYLPLDSSQIIFKASAGKFSGNSLWIDPDFKMDKVSITVTARHNPALRKEFDIYIKKKPDEQLKTMDELMKDMKEKQRSKKRKSDSRLTSYSLHL